MLSLFISRFRWYMFWSGLSLMLGGLPRRKRMCSFDFSIHSLAFLTFQKGLTYASLPLLLSFSFYAAKILLSTVCPPVISWKLSKWSRLVISDYAFYKTPAFSLLWVLSSACQDSSSTCFVRLRTDELICEYSC